MSQRINTLFFMLSLVGLSERCRWNVNDDDERPMLSEPLPFDTINFFFLSGKGIMNVRGDG